MKKSGRILGLILGLLLVSLMFNACGNGSGKNRIPVTRVTISGAGIINNALTATVGSKIILRADVSPSDATDKKIEWKSSDISVITITENGEITTLNPGDANITATADNKTGKIEVKVITDTELNSISFVKSDINVNIGSSIQLNLDFFPSSATNKNVIYTISSVADRDIKNVSVNAKGKVDVLIGAISGTEYIVTATSQENSNITAICKIIVQDVMLTSISVKRNDEAIPINSSENGRIEIPIDIPKNVYFFVPLYTPDNTSQQSVEYESSNPMILSIEKYDNLGLYSIGASAEIGMNVDVTIKGQNGTSFIIYATIVEAKNYIANELTVSYLNSLAVDKRTLWDIEGYGTDGETDSSDDDFYDTAGNKLLSQPICGGVAPWDGGWGVIFDTWDNPYKDNELPNQYMYNKILIGSNINIIEFRTRSHITPSPTSDRGKFRVRVLEPDGIGGYLLPVVISKIHGIGTADENGWIVISNTTVADYEAARDYFYFDISAYKGKTVIILFEVDDMLDDNLPPGQRDSELCDRICFLGAELQEVKKDRTSND